MKIYDKNNIEDTTCSICGIFYVVETIDTVGGSCMAIAFTLLPYEDEDLYSWIVRYCKHSIYDNETDAIEDLFGRRNYPRKNRYITNIDHLSKMMNGVDGFTIDNILDNMTYINIAKPFTETIVNEKIRQSMLHTGGSLHDMLGFHRDTMFIDDRCNIKVCPKCYVEDIEKYGEPYLHRSHNVVGVKTCYKHSCYLDIASHIFDKSHPLYDVENDYVPGDIVFPSKETIKYHDSLNTDIVYLLNGHLKNVTPDMIRFKVKTKLQLMGIYNSPIKRNDILIDQFYKQYELDFLNDYESAFDLDQKKIWLRHFLYRKTNKMNPIRQILALGFLFCSLKEFNEFNEEFEPFGKGPYPCLNMVCKDYHKDVIDGYKERFLINKNCIIGTFICGHCGYTYTRNSMYTEGNNKYKYARMNNPGDLWKRTLREYVKEGRYSITEISKNLGTNGHTIIKYINTMGLGHMVKSRVSKKHIEKEIRKKKYLAICKDKLLKHVEENPEESRSSINNVFPAELAYIKLNDKEWYELKLPKPENGDAGEYLEQFWKKRDEEYYIQVKDVIRSIIEFNEKRRITKSLISRRVNYTSIVQNDKLAKMKRVKKLLEEWCETHDEYKKRIESY